MDPQDDARYWDAVGTKWQGPARQTLWRTHSDAVNGAWLAPRLPTQPFERLLKTDLFDEALTSGLYPYLLTHAQRIYGVDISRITVQAAAARNTALHRAQADVRALPFADGAFDGIVSNSTLDHFDSTAEIKSALAELYRVLRSDGRLFLTLDNLANPIVALRNTLPSRLLNSSGIVPYGVGSTLGPRRLRRFVREAGFEILEVGAILHCPRVFAVAVAGMLESSRAQHTRRRFLNCLTPFERLGTWRTRFLTGYFVTVVARKC